MTSATEVRSTLIERIRLIRTDAEHRGLTAELDTPTGPTVVDFVNAHAIDLAFRDPALCADFAACDVLLRDGVGTSLALRALGRSPGRNMNGTDFIPELLGRYLGRPIVLFGSSDPWIGRAVDRLKADGHDIVVSGHGFHEPAWYLEAVSGHTTALIVLAMGMPKQEAVARALAGAMDAPVVIVNGGAIVDFLAERFPRAPGVFRVLRMEWLYRLMHEPRRLANRYIAGAPRLLRHIVELRRAGSEVLP